MIITRTPYRVSFFGGGTDYHTWYERHGGQVLSTTINHYNYISCRFLPPFHPEYKNRVAWKILEYSDSIDAIKHPAVRGALQYYGVTKGVEISNQCDLPARSGLGSSSSFSAGLINALKTLQGETISKADLAKETIYLERHVLKENVGVQDQIAVVHGGLNHIKISENGSFSVEPIRMDASRKREFNDHLLLFFTGVSRTASDICKKQIEETGKKTAQLSRMHAMVNDAVHILQGSASLDEFGKLLHETWLLKRSLTSLISNDSIDEIYATAIKNGAIGGKLLGAGGGGFMLFFAPPERHSAIKMALRNLLYVPFEFDEHGSQVILCDRPTPSQISFYEEGYVRRGME